MTKYEKIMLWAMDLWSKSRIDGCYLKSMRVRNNKTRIIHK